MSVEIIQEKLLNYHCQSLGEQENALKEISQEIALMALSRSNFFQIAAFQGGTCLRILYGLERFSEDLDFVLEKSDKSFSWGKYIHNMQEEFSAYGFTLEVKDREKLDKSVRNAFLKIDSEGGMLLIKDLRTNKPQLRIKLEIDTHPPEGSEYELKYLDFPLPYAIKTQDLPSLFSGKCHALLCRDYVKGRDWYDFTWYIARKTLINFELLNASLIQAGPWKNQDIKATKHWLLKELQVKINDINWDNAKKDVARFLKPKELQSLDVWSKDFFISRLEKMSEYLP